MLTGSPEDRPETLRLAQVLIYLLVSLMFMGIYSQMTIQWSANDYAAYVRPSPAHDLGGVTHANGRAGLIAKS